VILASIGVIAASLLSTGATREKPISAVRIIATPKPIPKFTPVNLKIPSLGVDADVVPVWTEQATGRMASPGTAEEVGWWAGRKAGTGNLLLDGHHDWNGKTGVFYKLPELKVGDEVTVTGDKPDKTLTYRVVWIKNYDRNIDATDLLGNKKGHQVATLITCGGTFDTIARTHRERVVARAELVA
jgi:LPXTG-site transpeptidase (sortase) family protein